MTDKTKFVWVRVGDGDPEPAALGGKTGERRATTIGCPDPFMLDEPGCPCKLVYEATSDFAGGYLAELTAPDEEISAEEANKRQQEYRAYIKAQRHSYAGFGRRRG